MSEPSSPFDPFGLSPDATVIVVPPDSAGLLFDSTILVRPVDTGEPDWRWTCERRVIKDKETKEEVVCGGPRRIAWDDITTAADTAARNRRYRLGAPDTCGQCGSTKLPRRVA